MVIKQIKDATLVFERVRQAIENIELEAQGQRIPIRASIGVTTKLCANLDKMLKLADEGSYKETP